MSGRRASDRSDWSGPLQAELFPEGKPLRLDNGAELSSVTVAYESWGRLNAAGDNAVLICHTLTGNAHALGPDGWWKGLDDPSGVFGSGRDFILCSNALGGCSGTTGPASLHPRSGNPWRLDFPIVTVRDMVRVQHELAVRLGINRFRIVIGGSLGGMQALEWAVMYPEMVGSAAAIACPARQSAWGIGLNEAGRRALAADPEWNNGRYRFPPVEGLKLARIIGLLSYRSPQSFQRRFGRERQSERPRAGETSATEAPFFKAESYLHYQGRKLAERFDAASYYRLSQALDSHDLEYRRGSLNDLLGKLDVPLLAVGIRSDLLYPAAEQKEIAIRARQGRYAEIDSDEGHDAFLIEKDQVKAILKEFFADSAPRNEKAGTLRERLSAGGWPGKPMIPRAAALG